MELFEVSKKIRNEKLESRKKYQVSRDKNQDARSKKLEARNKRGCSKKQIA